MLGRRSFMRVSPNLQHFGKRRQKPLVLGVGAERDADESRAAERAAGAHEHAALLQRRDDGAVVPVLGDAHPEEVGVALGDPEAALAQRLGDRGARGDRARPRAARPRPGTSAPRPRPPGRRWSGRTAGGPGRRRSGTTRCRRGRSRRAARRGRRPSRRSAGSPGSGGDRAAAATRTDRRSSARTRRRPRRGSRRRGRGSACRNASICSSGSAVLVGLFGLQTSTSRVATVTSAAIASRSWTAAAVSGTSIARAPEAAARCG